MPQKDTIVSEFLTQFPELKEHPYLRGDEYHDIPYVFFGTIRTIIEETTNDGLQLQGKVLKWLNTTFNNSEEKGYVETMLWIEFFEGSEVNELYRKLLLSNLHDRANLKYRQYLYIMENGGLTDPKTGEIKKYVKGRPSISTGKYISDIK